MIEQIIFDKAPAEDFLMNFSNMASQYGEKNIILLDLKLLDYIKSFSEAPDIKLDLNPDASLFNPTESGNNYVDDSTIYFRISNSKKESWLFEARSVSDNIVILTFFRYSPDYNLCYLPPKVIDNIDNVFIWTI